MAGDVERDWMWRKVKKGLRFVIYPALLTVLLAGLPGCAAETSPQGTVEAGGTAEEALDPGENGGMPKDSEPEGNRGTPEDSESAGSQAVPEVSPGAPEAFGKEGIWGTGRNRMTGEAPKGEKPLVVPLVATDHRMDGAVVREYADREAFLREYGFDGQEPFFAYSDEDGQILLELYYDKATLVGCGLLYPSDPDWPPEGFLFNGSGNYRYYRDFMPAGEAGKDPYSFLSFDGSDGKSEVKDYEESVLYREDGRPLHFDSRGEADSLSENETQTILGMDWYYREDGTLREKSYHHNDLIFGSWYSSRQSCYDERERLVREHCYVTYGSVDYYYIYEGEGSVPEYCLIIDHNLNLLCAELLEYHEPEGELYYGEIGPTLAGEAEGDYAAAALEAAERAGKDYVGRTTHTYAADFDGDSREEAFVIIGSVADNEYEHVIYGDCWFVDSSLEASLCVDRACAFFLYQYFIWQDGKAYLILRYTIGFPVQAEIYTVRDNEPVEISGSYADKYVDSQGHVILVENAYDGNCTRTNVGTEEGGDDWKYLWSGHSWKPYTFIFDHGQLYEVPAREVSREEVERIAPLPAAFDEMKPGSVKQYILRDNGDLNINMATEADWGEWEKDFYFSYITYRLNEDGEWEYVEEQMGYYLIQFMGESRWDYLDEVYRSGAPGSGL